MSELRGVVGAEEDIVQMQLWEFPGHAPVKNKGTAAAFPPQDISCLAWILKQVAPGVKDIHIADDGIRPKGLAVGLDAFDAAMLLKDAGDRGVEAERDP